MPSQFTRQNAKQRARSHPYTSLEGMANCEKMGFYIRGSDRKYAYHITTDPPSFFHSCVSFLGQNRAGALQKASKRLQSSQLGRSQHALHISSKKTAKKTIHGELLKKNTKKPSRIENYRLLYGRHIAG